MPELNRQPCNLPDCPYCPECGLSPAHTFAERISLWLDEEEVIREGLLHEGQRLVSSAPMSLRQLARRTGLSPTYLSMIANGKQRISPDAYLKVEAELEPKATKGPP